jgi:hypothetical protein
MMTHMFGLVDLIIAGALVLTAIIVLVVEIPEVVRYMKIRSM